ncbi:hypothetical protein FISHEDRAFT_53324 [Fistulina hepatica ATCC 64428]|nr:hypothetical protein FISHEDRAFT_53324 [Fistulina hepatica ATCC 64428]
MAIIHIPFGWCCITALGNFDYRQGGHLVLWDFGLVIQFPPGSTVLIPSAIVAHSNTSIARGERRYSITQFSAGGLFRWVDHGFQTEKYFFESLNEDELRAEKERQSQRWTQGLSQFSTLDELADL